MPELGTFPRVLKRYALTQGVISLENAIYKMTGFPAARFSLAQRGLVRQGFYADLVLLDPDTLEDRPAAGCCGRAGRLGKPAAGFICLGNSKKGSVIF